MPLTLKTILKILLLMLVSNCFFACANTQSDETDSGAINSLCEKTIIRLADTYVGNHISKLTK